MSFSQSQSPTAVPIGPLTEIWKLASEQSFLIFSKVNISKAGLISWKESNFVDENESFLKYKQYVKNLNVTNTVA